MKQENRRVLSIPIINLHLRSARGQAKAFLSKQPAAVSMEQNVGWPWSLNPVVVVVVVAAAVAFCVFCVDFERMRVSYPSFSPAAAQKGAVGIIRLAIVYTMKCVRQKKIWGDEVRQLEKDSRPKNTWHFLEMRLRR